MCITSVLNNAFENLKQSLEKLRSEQQYDQVWINALFALYQNLKSIDAQLRNLETERNIKLDKSKHIEQQLKDDDLKSWDDIVIRIKQHLTPNRFCSATLFVCRLCC